VADGPTPPGVNWRQAVGMLLLGLGVPAAGAGGLLFWMVFVPGRRSHRALVPFSEDHPYARVSGVLFLIGVLLIAGGLWLTRRPDRRSDFGRADHPLSFSDEPGHR